jgi:hypothetical protein
MPKRATVLLRYGLTPLALAALPMLAQAQGYYEI